MKQLGINSKFKFNHYAKAMTLCGIANRSENIGMKCMRRMIPESFLAETQTQVGLEETEGRWFVL